MCGCGQTAGHLEISGVAPRPSPCNTMMYLDRRKQSEEVLLLSKKVARQCCGHGSSRRKRKPWTR
eukprot:2302260-Amphidinium_carterae.1